MDSTDPPAQGPDAPVTDPRQSPGRQIWIKRSDLLQRLALRSDAIVDQLYEIAKEQLDDEEKRDAVLTTKANTVLGVSGLSLTVAFTFGGFLLQNPDRIAALGYRGFYALVVVFGLSLLLGLVASFLALRSLKVRRFEYVNESSVFDTGNLADVDSAWEKAWDGVRATSDRAALSVYRRFLTAHIWGIYQRNFDELEKKAESVKWAQRFYVGFLVTIMVIGVALTASVATIARRSNHSSAAPASLPTDTVRTDAGAPRLEDAIEHDATSG